MCFRDDALAGRHVVISGGCGAIGVGVVKKLTDHGASVTANDLLVTPSAKERLRAAGIDPEKSYYVQADLTQAAGADALVAAARSRFGPIHTALCHVGMVIVSLCWSSPTGNGTRRWRSMSGPRFCWARRRRGRCSRIRSPGI